MLFVLPLVWPLVAVHRELADSEEAWRPKIGDFIKKIASKFKEN